jgi:hypothetical protein
VNPIDIYYLPGRGGRLHKGLGEALIARGFNLLGRETVGEFAALAFHDQIELVANDLKKMFWHERAAVIANSYGAYLFLHAQAGLPAFPGRVLLLSPIVGGFYDDSLGTGFVPPLAEKLFQFARAGNMPNPQRCEMHVGSLDWQCDPEKVCALGALIGVSATVVPEAGHLIGSYYVGQVLDRWLQ